MALTPNISPKRYTKRFGTVVGRGNRFQVEGLPEVLRRLKLLPVKLQKKVIQQATGRACTPIVKQARKDAPVGDGRNPDGSPRQHLAKTINKRVKTYRNGNVVGIIGPIKNAAPHDHLVESGTKPHDIKLGKPLVFGSTILPAGFVIKHPGAKATHFLAKAFIRSRGRAQDIMEAAVAVGIEREAAKLGKSK